ncbi:diheme cytochrome c [Curvibacter sp. APW13]|uniref:diheme cytochrome c n=1 Tax=Curvibacter sp. APW13 TaxID=3077236 RepID=UPI0028DDEEA0|nr:diheme cytochrome c [Curvibacter sp. APW13]MDT8990177.1 diheme cytochrome c [Curvibacter sp. APW13]
MFFRTACTWTVLSLATTLALADGGGRMTTDNPKFQAECGSCHTPYAPALLPAASWQRLMGNLGKHFGTDASLDPATTKEIGQWVQANAGSGRRASEEPPQDRITKSAWFQRQHRPGEVPADAFKRASVGSPANCSACHPNAAKGNYNEHEVRIPR